MRENACHWYGLIWIDYPCPDTMKQNCPDLSVVYVFVFLKILKNFQFLIIYFILIFSIDIIFMIHIIYNYF